MVHKIFAALKEGRMGSGGKRARLLAEFQRWLCQNGESELAEQQCERVQTFVDSLLLEMEAETAGQAARRLATMMAYWFNREAFCLEPSGRIDPDHSVKRFRLFLRERGRVTQGLSDGNPRMGGITSQTNKTACVTSKAAPILEPFEQPVRCDAEVG